MSESPALQQPRLGCGAVIQRADGAILLVQRGRQPEQGHWGLPGGKVDFMEKVEDAVVREVLEETGLEVTVERLLCVVDHFEPALGQHWVAPVYLARVPATVQATLREPEAILALDWFQPDALPALLTVSATQGLAQLSTLR
ncbi:NUDIX domain-containing protein [Stenotrophomonas sp. JAI102]|uniref:NUDIX domain-containing protein n=1 Tax=Stenotrophomonas sp. JAI102 TaxID=2723077 RepID=UPI0015CAF6C9|nr:NUDIX domain-containing protein [Stenotrophomonas sp. JAI102]NYF36900.1 ADP-ribose pyrophosphatase YjhB (NUDIX family) [Stenotrophomonas sp. JAI102]